MEGTNGRMGPGRRPILITSWQKNREHPFDEMLGLRWLRCYLYRVVKGGVPRGGGSLRFPNLLRFLRLFQHTELEHTPSNLYQQAIIWDSFHNWRTGDCLGCALGVCCNFLGWLRWLRCFLTDWRIIKSGEISIRATENTTRFSPQMVVIVREIPQNFREI